MIKKLMLLGAGAVGYVLGAKAGRERYEQIAQQAQKLRSNPTVQQKMDEARHAAKDAADQAVEKVREQRHDQRHEQGHGGTSATGANTFGVGNEGPDRAL